MKFIAAILRKSSFSEKSPFCVKMAISRAYIFGAEMFIFTGYRPVMDKLLNTWYE
jgi:hypothetical protein